MLTIHIGDSAKCKGAFTVNCARLKHMKQCRKHPKIWYMKECATCLQEWQKEERERHAENQKAKDLKEKADDNFFSRAFGRKKPKGLKRNDVRYSPLKEKYKLSHPNPQPASQLQSRNKSFGASDPNIDVVFDP